MRRHADPSSADRLLMRLKVKGPQTTRALAEWLGISTPAVRQQARRLANEGVITMRELRGFVGRPRQRWSLTRLGHRQFPDAHADTTVTLIASIRDTLGEDALASVIADRYRATLVTYRERMKGVEGLPAQLERLRAIRSDEGYMAEVQPEGDGFLFVEHHCPICAAAEACQGFCSNELRLFRELLGDETSVERVEYLIVGDRRCAYRVRSLMRPTQGDS